MYNNKLLTINNNFFLFLFLIASYNINTDVIGNPKGRLHINNLTF